MNYDIKHEIAMGEEDLIAAIRATYRDVPLTATIDMSLRPAIGGRNQFIVSWITYGHPCTTDPIPVIAPKETE